MNRGTFFLKCCRVSQPCALRKADSSHDHLLIWNEILYWGIIKLPLHSLSVRLCSNSLRVYMPWSLPGTVELTCPSGISMLPDLFFFFLLPAVPTMQFTKDVFTVKEKEGALHIPIFRTGDLSYESSVRCYTQSQTAEVMEDFAERRNADESRITFLKGEKVSWTWLTGRVKNHWEESCRSPWLCIVGGSWQWLSELIL